VAAVVWSYSTLASVRINAANEFARDALAVYRLTVDRFIAQMVVAVGPLELHGTPSHEAACIASVQGGTVLLAEHAPDSVAAGPTWSYVRIPSTATLGWVQTDRLIAVDDEQ
jgi:hypothetical protein